MTTEMKMETRSLASLRPAEYNPRVQLQPADPEYQNIKRSIETFGYVDPIIINQDGTSSICSEAADPHSWQQSRSAAGRF